MSLYRIVAGSPTGGGFVAGIVASDPSPGASVGDARVTAAAPVVGYMVGWSLASARDYALGRGWEFQPVRNGVVPVMPNA